jgi:hypothetical protein
LSNIKKFIIFSPSYNEKSGGIIVLHKLCHLINELGYEAYIYPYFETYDLNKNNVLKTALRFIKDCWVNSWFNYKLNMAFTSPILKEKLNNIDLNEFIVVYPEIVLGNPLNAPNIVRWLLHQPGYHSNKIFYGKNELLFKFNSAIEDFSYQDSKVSSLELKVIHYPLEHYDMAAADNSPSRKGSAYCIRKGKGKEIQHNLNGSINIDLLSHKEVAEVFRRVEYFYSYDVYTAYSIFAVLSGCKSIVIPDKGVTIDDWYPNVEDRYGIAYGIDGLSNADKTVKLVRSRILDEEANSKLNVSNFAIEAFDFFSFVDNKSL